MVIVLDGIIPRTMHNEICVFFHLYVDNIKGHRKRDINILRQWKCVKE